jgi:parallel beta-helix repeat protein
VSESGDDGIVVSESEGNEVIENEVADCEGEGISVHSNSSDNLVRENNITESEIGIEIAVEANDNKFIGNRISDCGNIGILAEHESTNNFIYRNLIFGSMDEGIKLVYGANDNKVRKNKIFDSGEGMPSIEVGSDVGPMVITPEDDIFAAVSLWDDENDNGEVDLPDERYIAIWSSGTGGYIWNETEFDLDFKSGNTIVQMAVSTNYEDDESIYVATFGGDIYRLEEAGDGDIMLLPSIPGVDELYSIDVWFDGDDNRVMVGTDSGVFEIYDTGSDDWVDLGLDSPGYEVNYAPDFDDSELYWVITENGDGDFMIISSVGDSAWGDDIGEVEIGSSFALGGPRFS